MYCTGWCWKGVRVKNQKNEEAAAGSGKTAISLSEEETIAPDVPVPVSLIPPTGQLVVSEQQAPDTARMVATGGLAIILGQLVAYFTNRAQIDDLDVLSFSLHHLFCRVDFLYSNALPALAGWTATVQGRSISPDARQHIWTQLQIINRALDRMEPLCHLLSDSTECILESFDMTSEMIPLPQEEEEADNEQGWLQITDPERWEQAFSAVTQHLLSWQQNHTSLPAFISQFARLLPTIPALPELDDAFATILDNAGAIFGDILPGFRALLASDESMVAALLYDLMQQSDQLLIKFETTLEPMTALIKSYALGPELS